MLIDLHAHSGGISRCCKIPYDEVVRTALDIGLDGIVLTNHYATASFDDDSISFARRYVEEYRFAHALGESLGLRVFLGVEVTMERYNGVHVLLYGVDERFILENHTLYDLSLQQLHRAVKTVGGALIQAHPYRQKIFLDTDYLDGVEVNCHPAYGSSYFENVKEIAQKNGLILTCGGDYHADTYRPHCGTHLPDTLQNGQELAAHLLHTNEILLHIHEPNTPAPYDYCYVRTTLPKA